jgi:murein DD-endopeptidase MepM/ murein hydrolase activator NlpD
MIASMNGDVARMQQRLTQMETDVAAIRTATVQRAALLERRQAFLARMFSGQSNADELARLLPATASSVDNPAAQRLAASFDAVDDMQDALVDRAGALVRHSYAERVAAMRQLGVEPRLQDEGGVGGPYEPVNAADNADPRFLQLFTTWRALDRLQQGTAAIPSAFPLRNMPNFTSGFGVRADPFRGRAAMHPGVDLAGPLGTPVYATADGIVDRSEWNNGGYGNLVEIDHGQGIQTRYGHLSQRVAQPGQHIHRGDLIGLMGSTGRSTGSHLHYEVRIDGRPVNPIPFLQSSSMFMAMQRASTTEAIGGPEGGPVRGNR